MLVVIAAAAAFILSDGYDPAREVAWLCPQPETAAEIGLKSEHGASPGLISSLAQARKCVSWEGGTLNVRAVKHVGAQEIGLIRISNGAGVEISYWVRHADISSASKDGYWAFLSRAAGEGDRPPKPA